MLCYPYLALQMNGRPTIDIKVVSMKKRLFIDEVQIDAWSKYLNLKLLMLYENIKRRNVFVFMNKKNW